MRIAATFLATAVAAVILAACQPASEPAPAPAEPTAEEMGQDDPEAVFTPAPVGPPREYEAMSKTAMSFTPGELTLTPTPQKSVNLPEGAVFQFGNGYILDTTSMPGGATQGTPAAKASRMMSGRPSLMLVRRQTSRPARISRTFWLTDSP